MLSECCKQHLHKREFFTWGVGEGEAFATHSFFGPFFLNFLNPPLDYKYEIEYEYEFSILAADFKLLVCAKDQESSPSLAQTKRIVGSGDQNVVHTVPYTRAMTNIIRKRTKGRVLAAILPLLN